MITLWKCLALAAALLVPTACDQKPAEPAPPAPQPAETATAPNRPALWKTGDADTTVYLFGTVHVLPPTLDWTRPELTSAINESKAVYFETDIDPNPVELGRTVEQLGLYPSGDKLSNHLTPAQNTALKAAAEKLGLPPLLLETQKPWMAAMTMGQQMITSAGYDPASGAERSLEPIARAGGKEIRKFETVAEQLLAFADLPEAIQITYLMDGVNEMDRERELLDDLVNAWAKGDVAKLEAIMIEGDLAEMPAVYDALIVKRNKAWAEKLDALIKAEPGVFFVAVGAGHLAGKDSVNQLMIARGYQVTRLP